MKPAGSREPTRPARTAMTTRKSMDSAAFLMRTAEVAT
jgi:hypothetical protein